MIKMEENGIRQVEFLHPYFVFEISIIFMLEKLFGGGLRDDRFQWSLRGAHCQTRHCQSLPA